MCSYAFITFKTQRERERGERERERETKKLKTAESVYKAQHLSHPCSSLLVDRIQYAWWLSTQNRCSWASSTNAMRHNDSSRSTRPILVYRLAMTYHMSCRSIRASQSCKMTTLFFRYSQWPINTECIIGHWFNTYEIWIMSEDHVTLTLKAPITTATENDFAMSFLIRGNKNWK